MRYRLRTLLIVLALGPMVLAAAYWRAAALAKAEQDRLAMEAFNRWYSSVASDGGWRSYYKPQADSQAASSPP